MGFITGAGVTNIDLLYQGVDHLPGVGEEVYADGFSLQLGGGVPATLIHLARLGIETKLYTELGADLFSQFAKTAYAKYGITPVNTYAGTDMPVTVTSAAILPGDRSFLSFGKGLDRSEKSAEAFYKMAHGSFLCLMQPDGFMDVYRDLKSEGTLLVLDMGWDDDLSMEKYGDLLTLADYYTPNRMEAMKLTGTHTPEEAAWALKAYFENVIVKLDADGCLGIDGDDCFTVNPVETFDCVDATGAGDAFLAGFCYGLYRGASLRACIEYGNITGGKAVTKTGALSATTDEAELLQIKETYYQ